MVKLIDDILRVRPTELYVPTDRKCAMPAKGINGKWNHWNYRNFLKKIQLHNSTRESEWFLSRDAYRL